MRKKLCKGKQAREMKWGARNLSVQREIELE